MLMTIKRCKTKTKQLATDGRIGFPSMPVWAPCNILKRPAVANVYAASLAQSDSLAQDPRQFRFSGVSPC